MEVRGELDHWNIDFEKWAERLELCSFSIEEKCGALENFIGFIDGTVIGIERLDDMDLQLVVYNGAKLKQGLEL